jgi:hypothetical protein
MIRGTLPGRGTTLAFAVFAAVAASPAFAQGDGQPAATVKTTATPAGSGSAATTAASAGAAPPGSAAAESGPVTAEALARAQEATEQATRFRAAGDEAHAKAADGLAREWAETARDLTLAAAAEKLAEERKRQSMEAQAQLERTRALVEEGIARLGRIRAEIGASTAKVTAVESHDGQPPPAGAKGASRPQVAASGSTP